MTPPDETMRAVEAVLFAAEQPVQINAKQIKCAVVTRSPK